MLLKFSSLFRAVCSLFSNSPVFFERLASCSETLESLSSISLLVLKFSRLFRAVRSLFSNSLVSFVKNSCLFQCRSSGAFLSQFLCSAGLSFFPNSLVLLSGLLRVFKLSRSFRAVLFLVQIFSRLFRTVHHFFCSFGAVSCLFSNSLVSFERLAPCAQNSLALLERYAPVFSNSLMPFGRFAPFLKLCSLFRAVCCFFYSAWSGSSGLLLFAQILKSLSLGLLAFL